MSCHIFLNIIALLNSDEMPYKVQLGLTNLTIYGRFHKKPDFKFVAMRKQKRCFLDSKIATGLRKLFSYFSIKTYVVGTQKNCLDETV